MLEYDVDGLLDGFSFVIVKVSDVLCVNSCDNFLSYVSLNRKDLFEGPNKLFVVCFHCSDDELSSASWNNQKARV